MDRRTGSGWLVAFVAVVVTVAAIVVPAASGRDGRLRSDVRAEVVYGVVPELWRRGDETATAAVRRQLPRIVALGATVVWLWPPIARREEGEEYAVVDQTAIDDAWGGRDELRGLVEEAHRLGLRVIVDVVAGHTSRQHPWFAAADDEDDPTWAFYASDADGEPTTSFDWDHLADLDLDHPEVRRRVIGSLTATVRELGIDGYRLDAAWGPARRSPTFWPAAVAAIRDVDPDALLLAEAAADEAWLVDAGIDLAYDWRGGPGRWAWEDAWGADGADVLADRLRAAPAAPAVLRMLDSNDSGERFATVHGPDLARVAAVVALTAPGTPLVFAGQESGLAYEPYELQGGEGEVSRRPDQELEALYHRLIALRRRAPALRTGRIEDVGAVDDVLTFRRPAPAGGADLVVVANLGPDPATHETGDGRIVVRTHPDVDLEGGVVVVPPRSAVVLEGG